VGRDSKKKKQLARRESARADFLAAVGVLLQATVASGTPVAVATAHADAAATARPQSLLASRVR